MEQWRQCGRWLIDCRVLPPNHRVVWPSAVVFDLAQALRDGVLLCQLLHNLSPGSIDLKDVNFRPQMSQVSVRERREGLRCAAVRAAGRPRGPDPSGSLGDVGGRLDREPREDAPRASEPAASRGDPRRHEVSQSPPSPGHASAASRHCVGAPACGSAPPGNVGISSPGGALTTAALPPGPWRRDPASPGPCGPQRSGRSGGLLRRSVPWLCAWWLDALEGEPTGSGTRGPAGGAGGAGSPSRPGERVGRGRRPLAGPSLLLTPGVGGRQRRAPRSSNLVGTRAPRGFPRTLKRGLCRGGGACGCPAGRQENVCLAGRSCLSGF